MRHVEKALNKMREIGSDHGECLCIEIENIKDDPLVAPIVKFTIQSAPASEVGYNGCQARDMLQYLIFLFGSFNEAVPNRETSITITKLQEALMWQDERTMDRKRRQVEGTMEK